MYNTLDPNCVRLVRVDWEDIVFMDNWNDDETVQPQESTTVGYLLDETPTMIVIGGSYNWRDATWGTIHAISKAKPRITVLKGEK